MRKVGRETEENKRRQSSKEMPGGVEEERERDGKMIAITERGRGGSWI